MKSTNFTVDILLSAKNIRKQDQYNTKSIQHTCTFTYSKKSCSDLLTSFHKPALNL